MGLLNNIFSNQETLLKQKINNFIIEELQKNEMPWKKPWEGVGLCAGFPRDICTKSKFFGINFLLLQMSAKRNGFASSWWGTHEQFISMGIKVQNRPKNVTPGSWATEIIVYDKTPTSYIVYNYDQGTGCINEEVNIDYRANYDLADRVLNSTSAKIKFTKDGKALYFYPPNDFILFPKKSIFEQAVGGLPGYYESLAHELMHWSESRLGFDINCNEGIRELRADIGAAMLMEELGVPHSIGKSNFNKWNKRWIKLLKSDYNLIFKICASASKGADFIKSFSMPKESVFNEIDENLA